MVLGTDVLADNEPLILEVRTAPSSSTVSSMLSFPQARSLREKTCSSSYFRKINYLVFLIEV